MFVSRYLAEFYAELKFDLKDYGTTLWSSEELTRCIERAVADLSRFLPDEAVHEVTLDLDDISDTWTSAVIGTVSAVAIAVAGTDYTLGDILTVVGGTGTA
ncbi:unnamed protein product, partial [marine sediment metagenome]